MAKKNSNQGLLRTNGIDKLACDDLQQVMISQISLEKTIKYVENRELIFPGIKADEYVSVDEIMKKSAGNCNEGFILMADVLLEKGYDVSGLIVNPDNGEPGHIVAVYKDKATGKLGTAGISIGDFNLPVYSNLEEIADEISIKNCWNKATASTVYVNRSQLEKEEGYIELKRNKIVDIDINKKFNVSFGKKQTSLGDIEYEILDGGYRVHLFNTLIASSKMEELTGAKLIKKLSANFYEKNNSLQICIDAKFRKGHKDVGIYFAPKDGKYEINCITIGYSSPLRADNSNVFMSPKCEGDDKWSYSVDLSGASKMEEGEFPDFVKINASQAVKVDNQYEPLEDPEKELDRLLDVDEDFGSIDEGKKKGEVPRKFIDDCADFAYKVMRILGHDKVKQMYDMKMKK